ncbi:MAG: RluA family pseudouridine synthase [Acidimicrobiales bacterium]
MDRVVALLADISRGSSARLIAAGEVTLDDVVVTSGSRRVAEGEQVSFVVADDDERRPLAEPSADLDIRHEDAHVVVVHKPAGLVVHPGSGNLSGTLVNAPLDRYPEIAQVGEPHRPGIVHRLDRGTSGCCGGLTDQAYSALVEQMARHEPERVYTALVWGHLESDAGTIDAPIGRSTRHPTRMTVAADGRRAVTHYRVDARFDSPRPTTKVTCRLETGRTHQIRVHLRAIGHPVVGDRDYDGGRPGLDPGRPFLHAGSLRFRHPVTGAPIEVDAPLPDDLAECLSACR